MSARHLCRSRKLLVRCCAPMSRERRISDNSDTAPSFNTFPSRRAHTAAKQKEKEAKDELVRAREALSNPAKESAAPSTNGGGAAEGATPPQPARRLTAAEAQVAIKVAEDKVFSTAFRRTHAQSNRSMTSHSFG